MKKILFVVHSYYMLLTAIQIKNHFLQDDFVDIIISDASRGNEEILDRLKEEQLFHQCYFMRDGYVYSSKKDQLAKLYRLLRICWSPDAILAEAGLSEMRFDYDELFCYLDIRIQEQAIFLAIKEKNPNATVNIFEEGTASYFSRDGVMTSLSTLSTKILLPTLLQILGKGKNVLRRNVTTAWFFEPDFMQYKLKLPIIKIPKFSVKDTEFIAMVNYIFDFQPKKGSIQEKYIYLEDFTYADGKETDDKFIEKIEELNINRKNIIVKLHPRSSSNRFLDKKVSIYPFNVPLEILILNHFNRKILISIASGGLLTALVDFDSDVRVIMLYECLECRPRVICNKGFDKYVTAIKEKYGNRLLIPSDISDLKKCILQEEANGEKENINR